MKRLTRFFIYLIILRGIIPAVQAQDFTWKKGSKAVSQWGVYGSLGVSSPSNHPGARSNVYNWTDAAGNLWLFGGGGYDNFGHNGGLSDLWKYSPATNEWTWIKGDSMYSKLSVYGTKGMPSASNQPGARYGGSSWKDAAGNFWLFGGVGVTSSGVAYLNDLWKYNVGTNQWTWMGGSNSGNQAGTYGVKGTPSATNSPGARCNSGFCVDASGNFWLFGGAGYGTTAFGMLNDLWRYNPSSGQWTWLSGSGTTYLNGVYGTAGTASVSNVPGSRQVPHIWAESGNVWVFGGNGMNANNSSNMTIYLNDVWKFNVSGGQWTWMKGSSTGVPPGVYGSQEVFAGTNTPGGRVGGMSWKDASDKFWVFGGAGISTATTSGGKMNDLWKYDPVTNQWAWMKGSQTPDQHGIYGTQGQASTANNPGGRHEGAGWIDVNNDLWIFGGLGWPETGMANVLNDLWKFTNCSSQTLTISHTPSVQCSGQTSTITVTGGNSYTWSVPQSGTVIVVSPNVTSTYSVESNFNNGCVKIFPVTQSVSPPPALTIAATPSVICAGSSGTLTATGASSYSWSSGQTGSLIMVSPPNATTYSLLAANEHGCTGDTSVFQPVSALPVVNVVATNTLVCSGSQVTLSATGAGTYAWSTGQSGMSVVISPTAATSYTVTGANQHGCEGSAVQAVSVNPLPAISVISSDTQICSGTSATLSATGANSYTWSMGQTSVAITVSPPVSTTYSVSGTDLNGCVGSASILQVVNPTPTLSAGASDTLVCSGTPVTLSASGALNYLWSGGIAGASLAVSPTVNTVYTVKGSNAGGCSDSALVTVAVKPLPVLNLMANDSLICAGESVTIKAGGANTYTWSDNSQADSLLVSPVVTSIYVVDGTATNGCTGKASITVTVDACTSLVTGPAAGGFLLYPNPAQGRLNIKSAASGYLIVRDVLGRQILFASTDGTTQLDISALPPGIYSYSFGLTPGFNTINGKLLIE